MQAKRKAPADATAREDRGQNMFSLIPSLGGSHGDLFSKIQDIIASTPTITIICGAGISTRAGIPVRAHGAAFLRQRD